MRAHSLLRNASLPQYPPKSTQICTENLLENEKISVILKATNILHEAGVPMNNALLFYWMPERPTPKIQTFDYSESIKLLMSTYNSPLR